MGEKMSEVTFEVPSGENVHLKASVDGETFLVEIDAGPGRVYRASGRLLPQGLAVGDGGAEG